jgi:hypothetical protein
LKPATSQQSGRRELGERVAWTVVVSGLGRWQVASLEDDLELRRQDILGLLIPRFRRNHELLGLDRGFAQQAIPFTLRGVLHINDPRVDGRGRLLKSAAVSVESRRSPAKAERVHLSQTAVNLHQVLGKR